MRPCNASGFIKCADPHCSIRTPHNKNVVLFSCFAFRKYNIIIIIIKRKEICIFRKQTLGYVSCIILLAVRGVAFSYFIFFHNHNIILRNLLLLNKEYIDPDAYALILLDIQSKNTVCWGFFIYFYF